MTASTKPPSNLPSIGGTVEKYTWNWQGKTFKITYETEGQGQPILLLPAFSTVSSRAEMAGIAKSLSSQYRVVAVDWLGFGDSERPPLDYRPEIYHQLLQSFVKSIFDTPVIIIAAGHGAGYALKLAKNHPDAVAKIILVAPTWQGPLRVMGLPEKIRSTVREMVRSPFIGQTLYQLNTTPSFLRFMYGSHVYVDKNKLTPEFIKQKREITQGKGARFAPAAFVTGRIDPVESRQEFHDYFQGLPVPVKVIIAEDAPPASKSEMLAIAALAGVETARLPGTLGIYEEYSDTVVEEIQKFL